MGVTYLLGAGASAGSLPTVNEFVGSIQSILNRETSIKNWLRNKNWQNKYDDAVNLVFEDLRMLQKGCIDHRSVDTFAKMLFLTQDKEDRRSKYRRVKCAIILFFELHRYYTNDIDKRYDAFLATIFKKNLQLPSDINILSWNYDYEFERAYLKYVPEKNDIHKLYQDLNIIHKGTPREISASDRFSIIKINGTCGFWNKDGEITLGLNCHNIYHEKDDEGHEMPKLLKIFEAYKHLSGVEYEPAISFSWEDGVQLQRILGQIALATRSTGKLIVIGYSFPYFNRDVDKVIINQMRKAFGQISVQDLHSANTILENIKEMFDWQSTVKFKSISDPSQFNMDF